MEFSTAAAHAEATSHTNFAESTEAVLNLVCADCGKPCRSQTEVDLHKKRTGHAEFTDKTMEAAKPIDLEAPPKPAAEGKDVDASGSAEPQQLVAPEVNKGMLGELESMGFSVARATRALHFSGGAVEEEYEDVLRRVFSLITQKVQAHTGNQGKPVGKHGRYLQAHPFLFVHHLNRDWGMCCLMRVNEGHPCMRDHIQGESLDNK
ncbi:F-box protein [Hordeum vulgare]|nr:F-box protein [Hordeum vulgare]